MQTKKSTNFINLKGHICVASEVIVSTRLFLSHVTMETMTKSNPFSAVTIYLHLVHKENSKKQFTHNFIEKQVAWVCVGKS